MFGELMAFVRPISTFCLAGLLLAGLMQPACVLALESEAIPAPEKPATPAEPPKTDVPTAPAQSVQVTIGRFEVEGNSLLSNAAIQAMLVPFTGDHRGFADIQRAVETLEAAYRTGGYSTVQVYVPEQDIEGGVVKLKVVEAVLGKISFSGQQHHDETNLKASLTSLQPGMAPNARRLSESIQLINQNPSKVVDVVLSVSDIEGQVDAKVTVADDNPRKILLSADNTGNQATGKWRTGIGFRHANLFNRDHEITLNFTTSPDHYSDVKQYSLSYRLPLYTIGDSIDFIAAKSDTSTGTSPLVGGNSLSFSGSGNVYGLHYNHNFARRGEYSSRLVAGLDWRAYNNDCTFIFNGTATDCGSSGADVTVHPVSLTYAGDLTSPGRQVSFHIGYMHNIPGGKNGNDRDFRASRPNTLNINDGADAGFQVLRAGVNVLKILPANWQVRIAAESQFTDEPLVSGEQFGLAGVGTVRGFQEREESSDRGYVVNAEVYTPELGQYFGFTNASLRALLFVDHARGEQVKMQGETTNDKVSLGSAGLGLRYAYGRDINARLDVGNVIDQAGNQRSGDWRGHFSVNVEW